LYRASSGISFKKRAVAAAHECLEPVLLIPHNQDKRICYCKYLEKEIQCSY
jgi:hypothetical protein